MFVDRVKICVRAGNGGSGCVSFRREKYVPKGGPNGGDGGHGGSVVLVADSNLSTLQDFKYRPSYQAQRAEHGQGSNKHGKSGSDLQIKVPLGTIVKDAETGAVLADLVEDKETIVVARGGRGGRGNARFVSPTNRAPREWESGEFGEEKELEFELKLIADVGLVGLPNSGKSTLISKISAAKPKIADYPFTTLSPNLGIVKYHDFQSFVVADIPGLIEGAHLGKGLGHEFLRHIERTKLIVMLIDCTSEDPMHDHNLLVRELEEFNPELPQRVRVICFTKMDLYPEEQLVFDGTTGASLVNISSVTGDGLTELKNIIWNHLQELEAAQNEQPA